MSGINQVNLLGRIGKDPELKNAGGVPVCNFSVATSKTWKDEGGEKHEKTQWTDVVCFRKTAEIAAKYLSKGRQVYVTGELQTSSWDDKETGKKRYRTEVIAHHIEFIGDGKGKDGAAEPGSADATAESQEIPF